MESNAFPGLARTFRRVSNIETSFENLGLAPELLRAIAEQGYTQPTPIQSQAIPVVLSGRDLDRKSTRLNSSH